MSNVTDKTAVSIIIPVYNEEESILLVWQSVRRAVSRSGNPTR